MLSCFKKNLYKKTLSIIKWKLYFCFHQPGEDGKWLCVKQCEIWYVPVHSQFICKFIFCSTKIGDKLTKDNIMWSEVVNTISTNSVKTLIIKREKGNILYVSSNNIKSITQPHFKLQPTYTFVSNPDNTEKLKLIARGITQLFSTPSSLIELRFWGRIKTTKMKWI